MTSDRRGRRSLQFCKIIDALYILKGFATSGRRGADSYRFKIDAEKTYTLFLCALSLSPLRVQLPPGGSLFVSLRLAFTATSHRPTKKLHQAGRAGVYSRRVVLHRLQRRQQATALRANHINLVGEGLAPPANSSRFERHSPMS